MSAYRNANVLLTGHTGFKGSWFTVLLDVLGANVAGYSKEVSMSSFYSCLPVTSNRRDFFGDIVDLDYLMTCMIQSQPDIIFHFAAQPLVAAGYSDPHNTFMTNTVGTLNVLEAARRLKIRAPIILITTDKVYHNPEVRGRRYAESDALWGSDPYAASKVGAEQVAWSYSHISRYDDFLKVIVARAGNVIGGGDFSPNRIVPDFLKALNEGYILDVRMPNAVRPWQHVLEPLWGYVRLGEAALNSADFPHYSSWNFGPGVFDVISVRNLIMGLNNLVDRKVEVNWNSVSSFDEADYLDLDSDKALCHLGWAPRWRLEHTLLKIIDWNRVYNTNTQNAYGISRDQVEEFMGSL